MKPVKILTISGSLRKDSFNTKVLKFASRIATGFNVEIVNYDLKELPLPLFDEDLDYVKLTNVHKFKVEIEAADILMISSPEYNHSLSGVLKNAIDWASRNKNSFNGKTAIIIGATQGVYGTIRMQFHLRQILTALNVHMEPQPQVLIGNIDKILDSNGNITDIKIVEQLTKLIEKSIMNFRKREA
jgi:chromate reductase, NAD(P)H dehydrogenase (quinone)